MKSNKATAKEISKYSQLPKQLCKVRHARNFATPPAWQLTTLLGKEYEWLPNEWLPNERLLCHICWRKKPRQVVLVISTTQCQMKSAGTETCKRISFLLARTDHSSWSAPLADLALPHDCASYLSSSPLPFFSLQPCEILWSQTVCSSYALWQSIECSAYWLLLGVGGASQRLRWPYRWRYVHPTR